VILIMQQAVFQQWVFYVENPVSTNYPRQFSKLIKVITNNHRELVYPDYGRIIRNIAACRAKRNFSSRKKDSCSLFQIP
jgi:hypothetical protein